MQESYLNLPPRSSSTSHNCTVLTNVYEIRTQRFLSKYFLYRPKTDANIAQQLTRHMKQHKNQKDSIYQKIGFLCFYKGGLLGNIKLEDLPPIKLASTDSKELTITVELAKAEEVEIQQMVKGQKGMRFMWGLLGTALRRVCDKKQSQTKIYKLDKFQFEASFQLQVNLAALNSKIWLTTDINIKINEQCSVLEYIEKYNGADCIQLLKGAKVMKKYGKKNIGFIVSIERGKNPTTKMDGEDGLTFQEYYLKKYNIKIKNLTQPLLIIRKSGCNHKNTNKRRQQTLIPQLLSLVDKSCRPDFPAEAIKKLQRLKQLLPQQKQSRISQLISELGAEDIIKKSAVNLQATHLINPTIILDGMQVKPEEGIFQFRNKIFLSPELKNWAVAYSIGKDEEKDKQDRESLIGYFRNLIRIYGINIMSNPSDIVIKQGNVQNWRLGLQQNFKKFGRLQVIVVLLKEDEESYYYQLKQLCTLKLKCCSQMIRKRSIFSPTNRKPYSMITDTMIQIITKIGAIPWDVSKQKTALTQSLVMQGAIHLTKSQAGFALSLVGSTGKEANLLYSCYKKNIKSSEELKVHLQNVLMGWAKSFVINLRVPPQTIILYSQSSVGNPAQVDLQYGCLLGLVKKIGQKTKKLNYSANLAFVEVAKQSKIQFYSRGQSGNQSGIILKNIESGTVVFEQALSSGNYNFYLESQYSFKTTVKPVKYKVRCNNENITKEHLAQFTYEQCHAYFNYQGAFSVPALLQNAIKLTKLSSHFSESLDSEDKLSRTPYYL